MHLKSVQTITLRQISYWKISQMSKEYRWRFSWQIKGLFYEGSAQITVPSYICSDKISWLLRRTWLSALVKCSDEIFCSLHTHIRFYPCHLRNPNLPSKNSNTGPTFSKCDISRTIHAWVEEGGLAPWSLSPSDGPVLKFSGRSVIGYFFSYIGRLFRSVGYLIGPPLQMGRS